MATAPGKTQYLKQISTGAIFAATPELLKRLGTEFVFTEFDPQKDDPNGGIRDTKSAVENMTDEERITAIFKGVQDLDDDEFNKDGSPNITALEKLLGWKPDKKDVAKAHAILKGEKVDD